ncbi:MAG: hypothetical protein QM767_01700 [Anaeromyxobacter sp.]
MFSPMVPLLYVAWMRVAQPVPSQESWEKQGVLAMSCECASAEVPRPAFQRSGATAA